MNGFSDTGVIRNFDPVGRVTIPANVRKRLFPNNTQVEIHVSKSGVLLKPHVDTCVICGSKWTAKKIDDKSLCNECIETIKNTL